MPNVSVLMSVYNGGLHIAEAIESILGQTYGDFEFIITDDGSSDNSFELLTLYADSDPRIVIMRQENSGLTVTLNRMIAAAKGRYVARQDADDISARERLAEQVAFIELHPEVALLGTGAELIDAGGSTLRIERVCSGHSKLASRLLHSNQFIHGSLFFRRDIMKIFRGYDERFRYAQDYDLSLRVVQRYQVENIDKTLYRYRINECTITSVRALEQQEFAEVARRRAQNALQGKHVSMEKLLQEVRAFPWNRIIRSRAAAERARVSLLTGRRRAAATGFLAAFALFPHPRYLWHIGRSVSA